jgi:hypothetical protein
MAKLPDYVPQAKLAPGTKGAEVGKLQQYLRKFGYFEDVQSSAISELFALNLPVDPTPGPAPQKENFDEATTTALKKFQAFNHLPVTGELDDTTLAQMQQPRCGFPDIGEFANTGRRWPTTNLTYSFQEFSPDLPQGQIIQAAEQAFALWTAVTPLCFRRVTMAESPMIVNRFVTGDHGDGNPFDGPSGILAHAFFPPIPPNPPQPIQGDTHFDEAETWSIAIPPPAGTFDLVTVAAHEYGHALGLGHSSVAGALMAPFYGGPHRFLHSDDIAGITQIYGGRPIEHAMWIHGTSIQVELPENIASMRRYGFFTRLTGKQNTQNWFHFAIPTPVIVANNRLSVGRVMLRFRTMSANAIVRDVHIYDGSTRIAAHNGINLSGDHWFEIFGVPHCHDILWGLGISIGVTFTGGTDQQRTMDFIAAGCDFAP